MNANRPLYLADLLCHSQAVERRVKLVTQVTQKLTRMSNVLGFIATNDIHAMTAMKKKILLFLKGKRTNFGIFMESEKILVYICT